MKGALCGIYCALAEKLSKLWRQRRKLRPERSPLPREERSAERSSEVVLQDGPQKAEWIHGQLKEIYGITSPKLISEVSAEMVQRRILKKVNLVGDWLWELTENKITLAEVRGKAQMEFTE